MSKYTHVARNAIIVLVVTLLPLMSGLQQEYIIVPEGKERECSNLANGTLCVTINQLESINQDADNISIVFTKGNYSLAKRYAFINISSLDLVGNNGTIITCIRESGFSFENIENLVMENLSIRGCIHNQSGGAVFAKNVDKYQITKCIFVENKASMNGGAIFITESGFVMINDSVFVNNSANCVAFNKFTGDGGALEVFNTALVKINNGTFQENQAFLQGGAVSSYLSQLNITDSAFTLNTGGSGGGAIAIVASPFLNEISRSHFMHNSAYSVGGAIHTHSSEVVIKDINFVGNYAKRKGGAVFAFFSNLWITQSVYVNNTSIFGGSISMYSFSNVSIEKGSFESNFGRVGGVVFMVESAMQSTSTIYLQNSASVLGGVIVAINSTRVSLINDEYEENFALGGGVILASNVSLLESENCTYFYNTAINGGAILATNADVKLTNDVFNDNSAVLFQQQAIFITDSSTFAVRAVTGGAILIINSSVQSVSTQYIRNTATHFSGAIYALSSNLNIDNGTFISNEAENGAALYAGMGTKATITDCTFTSNQAFNNSVLSAVSSEIETMGVFSFYNNSGSLSVFDSTVRLGGEIILMGNNGILGGAIDAVQSRIEFIETSTAIIQENFAVSGGGVSLIETLCSIASSNVVIQYNTATENGGGIYAIQSQMEIKPRGINDTIMVANNKANLNGGGFHSVASQTRLFRGHLSITSNSASEKGGAFYLESNSKIYVSKMVQEKATENRNVILKIEHNTATMGGAVYIEDSANTGSLCRRNILASQPLIPEQCFLQTIQLYPNLPFESFNVNGIINDGNSSNQVNSSITSLYCNVLFANNTAKHMGNEIYGGLLDRCALNPLSELSNNEENITLYNGFDYIKLLAEFQGLVDYEALQMETEMYPFNIIQAISKDKLSNLIASEPVQVCFCTNKGIDCDYNPSTIFTKKGETFSISLTAVDQLQNPTKANLIGTIQSANGVHRLKEGQGNQTLNDTCTKVKYNVFAANNLAQLEIHADGPCRDFGISKRTLNITFTKCTCPVGFIPAPSDIECICLCHNQLMNYVDETKCIAENKSINVIENVWIGLTTSTNNESNFLFQNCPFDYCVEKPFVLTLDTLTIDEQCNHNRTGYLCGRCKQGLSQVFGSSKCDKCTNFSLFLLIPFALAGIALVALILILNMTVAIGTTNGLIFYANILAANHSIFLQGSKLNIFIAWINLDLGIETCFYDGMDTYGKFLLQLVFPAYIFTLVGAIIIASQYSQRISDTLGKKNPIATLSTLILLSYSKLLSMIITSLQFTTLQFPEYTKVVWLLDANVQYIIDLSHIPRFIIAILITVFGLVYTVLLLFAQCFHSCPKKTFLKWIRNPKYNAFIDAYHAPFIPNSRYWVGLLLMLRIVHFIISAVATKTITVLSVGCIAFFVLSIRVMTKKAYKLWPNNVLENVYIINLGLLAIFTYFVLLTQGQQSTITDISLAIALALFVGIIFYHLHEYVLKSSKIYRKNVSKMYSVISKLKVIGKKGQAENINAQQFQLNHGFRDSSLSIQIPRATVSVVDNPNNNHSQDQ